MGVSLSLSLSLNSSQCLDWHQAHCINRGQSAFADVNFGQQTFERKSQCISVCLPEKESKIGNVISNVVHYFGKEGGRLEVGTVCESRPESLDQSTASVQSTLVD